MKAKEYEVLERAVEEGVAYGLTRAHKHTDVPTRDQLQVALEIAVMAAIFEVFELDDVDAVGSGQNDD